MHSNPPAFLLLVFLTVFFAQKLDVFSFKLYISLQKVFLTNRHKSPLRFNCSLCSFFWIKSWHKKAFCFICIFLIGVIKLACDIRAYRGLFVYVLSTWQKRRLWFRIRVTHKVKALCRSKEPYVLQVRGLWSVHFYISGKI